MSGVRAKGLHQDLALIFGGGAASALSDGQLLDRFLGPAGETSEQAFEALVTRHGPMVLRVCQQVVGNRHDAEDAFQAVFLVLARSGGSVRRQESVASWLYGVSLRVAARFRKGQIRRRVEQQTDDDLDAVEAPVLDGAARWNESAEIVHQEVGRLAEKYRAPIVLCYLEGFTHDQAAARLKWPVGTVRSRLARGRDRLRGRLVRRGVTAPVVLGPLAAWLGAEAGTTAHAAALTRAILPAVPANLVASTVRSASLLASGKNATVAVFSASSLALTKEVLRTMAMKRIAVAAWALIPAGVIVFAAGRMLGQEPGRKGAQSAAASQGKDAKTEKAAAAPVESPKVLVDPLEEKLLLAARQRLDAQRAYYEKGRITVDRFVAASQEVMAVERMVSRTKEEVLAAIQRHVDRLQEIKAREEAEIKVGRGTAADLAEANQSLLQAEVLLKKTKMPDNTNPDLTAQGKAAKTERAAAAPVESPKVLVDPLEEKLLLAARQRLDAQRAYYEEGRITIDRFLAASQEVMVVERMVSRTKEEVLAAIQRHIDRLQEIKAREEAEIKVGRGTAADLAEANQSLLQAEVLLKKTKMPDKTNPDLTALERRLSEVERKLEVERSVDARERRLIERRLRNVEQKLDLLLKQQAEKPR
jgi:RNA polymerase sigma factor (sigma-70 family)